MINENANEIFDYPNFILFDVNGDTLAVETVNFFGIGGESWHVLNLHPDATVPVDPFYGTLQLWTLFTEELSCEWMPFIDLCPPAPCTTIIPNVQNLGGALAIGDYNYALMDADMNSVASGTLTMTSDMQFDADTLCLPPGDYWMACYAAQPPTGGAPWFGVMTPGWIAGPQHPVSFDLPVITPFSFYEPCIDGTNGIAEAIGAPLSILRMGDAAAHSACGWRATGHGGALRCPGSPDRQPPRLGQHGGLRRGRRQQRGSCRTRRWTERPLRDHEFTPGSLRGTFRSLYSVRESTTTLHRPPQTRTARAR